MEVEDVVSRVPIEILDIIFAQCDVGDILNFRLVNKKWRICANIQLAKRVLLSFKQGKKQKHSGENESIAATVKSISSASEYENFRIVGAMPKTFETCFKSSVVSLYLKDIVFKSTEDFRRVMYDAFPSMKELGLDHIWLKKTAVKNHDSTVNRMGNELPKLRRLVIEREAPYDNRMSPDIFGTFDVAEIITSFAGTIKEFHVRRWRAWNKNGGRVEKFDFVPILKRADIYLEELALAEIWDAEGVATFNSYLQTHGKDIKHIEIGGSYLHRLEPLHLSLCPLEFLAWRFEGSFAWRGEDLVQLKHFEVRTFARQVESFEFMRALPNVEIVDSECISPDLVGGNYVAVKVHTLKFSSTSIVRGLDRVFPNVRTLIMQRHDNVRLFSYLADVASTWPHLESLEIREHRTDDDHDRRARNFDRHYGNVDPRQLQWLRRLENLRSYIHHDVRPFRVCYDDRCALEVFLHIPSLKIMQVGQCSMSDEVIDALRRNLTVFRFKERV